MANKPFEREIINVREKPFSSDINMTGTYADVALRETLRGLISQRQSISDSRALLPQQARFLGNAFQVVPLTPAARSIVLLPGIGFVGSVGTSIDIQNIIGLNDSSELKPLVLSRQQVLDVPAGFFRVDIVEVRSNAFLTDSQSRDVFNPISGVFEPQDKNKTFSWTLDGQVGYTFNGLNSTAPISYKQGVNGSASLIPDTTEGYTKIAEIYVPSAVGGIDESSIVEFRSIVAPYGQNVVSGAIKLPKSVLLDTTTFHPPEIVSLSAPPGVVVGCSQVNVASSLADLTFGDFEVVVKGRYQNAHGHVNLAGYNRLTYEVALAIGSNFFVTSSHRAVLQSVDVLDEAGDSRANRLKDPAKTGSPITIRSEQPVVVLNFGLSNLAEFMRSPGIVVPSFSTDPFFVMFTIYLSH